MNQNRSPHGLICLFLSALLIFPTLTATAAQANRPNILFAFADDWGRYASAYAKVDDRPSPNDIVKTPHFDRVAKNGVLFKNAFVTAPSCTPCRSSLLSGQYFFRTGRGAILQGARWDPAIPSYPLLLQQAGYHIGETHKVWSPGTPNDAPYGAGKYGYEKAGRQFNQFSQNVTRMIRNGTRLEQAKQKLYDEVLANFQAFLDDRKEGQPFCYWFGPTEVHRKWVKGSGKTLWGIDPNSLKGKLPKFLPDVHEIREDFADYLGEVQSFDSALGLLLQKLQDIGQLTNTLIVVSGDHGAPGFPGGKCNLYDFGVGVPLAAWWPGGKGGRVVEDFVNLMDLAPTFLETAGLQPPEIMTGRSFVNILASDQQGLVDPQRQWVITGRERHVARARTGQLPYPQRALRTYDYLYIINFKPDRWPMGTPEAVTDNSTPPLDRLENDTFVAFADMDASPTKAWLIDKRTDPEWTWHYNYAFGKRPREELYILESDPDQLQNVADQPQHSELRKKLNDQLMTELARLGDPRVSGNGDTFDLPPYAGEGN